MWFEQFGELLEIYNVGERERERERERVVVVESESEGYIKRIDRERE